MWHRALCRFGCSRRSWLPLSAPADAARARCWDGRSPVQIIEATGQRPSYLKTAERPSTALEEAPGEVFRAALTRKINQRAVLKYALIAFTIR